MIELIQKLTHTLEQALPRLGYHKREGASESLSECRARSEGRPCGCREDTGNVVIILPGHCKAVVIRALISLMPNLRSANSLFHHQVPDRKRAEKSA